MNKCQKKKGHKKPFAIEWKAPLAGNWKVYSRYETEDRRDQALKTLTGTTYFGTKFEFRAKV